MSREQLIHLKILERTGPSAIDLAFDSFLLDAQARKLTTKTIKYYREQLSPFLTQVKGQGVTTPERVTAHHIRSYIIALQDRGLADASVHAFARAIRAFCNFLVREELLDKSPMRNVQMPRMEKPIKPAFTPDDVKAILKACELTRDTAMVLCLLDTGCRAVEFISLNVGDVDIKTGSVKVRHGKGRKHRVAFLGARARKAFMKYLMERDGAGPMNPYG